MYICIYIYIYIYIYIVLLALPSENAVDEIKRQRMEINAHEQLNSNKIWAIKMKKKLTIRFETNLPKKLMVDNVVHRDLSHKFDKRNEQYNLIDRYTQLYNKGFI